MQQVLDGKLVLCLSWCIVTYHQVRWHLARIPCRSLLQSLVLLEVILRLPRKRNWVLATVVTHCCHCPKQASSTQQPSICPMNFSPLQSAKQESAPAMHQSSCKHHFWPDRTIHIFGVSIMAKVWPSSAPLAHAINDDSQN